MPSIEIPEPCHENWADFTPTEKGAFCGSCQIDVVDFSNKSPEEVKAILKENAGKHMCGRFRKSQLEDLNNSFFAWENQSARSFQSKFLYACLLAFGLSLFTSCSVSEQNFLGQIGFVVQDENTAGLNITKPAAVHNTDTQSSLIEDESTTHPGPGDTVKVVKNDYKKGKIKYEPEEMLLGKPSIKLDEENTPPDTLIETIMGDTIIYNDEMIDGEISWTEDFQEYIEDTTATNCENTTEVDQEFVKGEVVANNTSSTPEDSTHQTTINSSVSLNVENSTTPVFESLLYPNPSSEKATIVINVNQSNIFNI
ncbi:MAG: hypothetical protein HUJ25_17775, partial [Crocinitomicaceae bacterium]|nr:hypothetical protein [Crocinitomicaceae bacterium]